MKSLFSVFIILCTYCFGGSQPSRYWTPIFDSIVVTSDLIYGENFQELIPDSLELIDLKLDFYEPYNDTLSARPLVIMVHAGSFLPKGVNQLPYGTKEDSVNVTLCRELAKRGFVCASIDFRLGWNPVSNMQIERSKTFVRAIYRSMLDVKTAIRFFNKDAATTQQFRTDSLRVIVAGNNTGALTALFAGYLNRMEEIYIPVLILPTPELSPIINMDTLGQLDGSGGHPDYNLFNHAGYGSNIHMVLNLGGGLPTAYWLDSTDQPGLVSCHEVFNPIVPYGEQNLLIPFILEPVLPLSGSLILHQYIEENNLGFTKFRNISFGDSYTQAATQNANQAGYPYSRGLYTISTGLAPFEPWAWYDPNDPFIDQSTPGASGYGSIFNPFNTPTVGQNYVDTILNFFAIRACAEFDLGCADLTRIRNGSKASSPVIQLFPNPANGQIWLESQDPEVLIKEYALFDLTGRKFLARQINPNKQITLNIDLIPNGIYSIMVYSNKGTSPLRFVKME